MEQSIHKVWIPILDGVRLKFEIFLKIEEAQLKISTERWIKT